ncbi:uncharacterized protein LOC124428752 isoform X1 [Vespa crabro]|uniref:uncharacterized protein LOC124428752 isoform X1 n=1 Tax=Vespa crabro TaxID=7445 RepID=UPI001F02C431|nr:uncharacterized protein LOC124428752 isoform X1 [Vespa crabro]
MADLVGYTHEFLAEFIQLYRAQPCLWQIRCKGYKDRLLRGRAYDVLVQKLREVNEYADKDTVIRKINTLRTAFRREYNKVKSSQIASDDPQNQYKSSLWYYDLLKFVAEQNNDEMTSMTATTGGKSEISSKEENYLTNISNDETLMHNDVEKIEPPSPTPSRSNTPNSFRPVILGTEGSYGMEYSSSTIDHLPQAAKKRKHSDCSRGHCTRSTTQSAYEARRLVSCSTGDDLETFGLYVASKLKKSTERQCIIAERIIAEVLLRANFGTLDESTTLTEKSPSRCFLVMGDR